MTRHFLGVEKQALYAEARLEAVRAVARLARDTGCAFAVVCGDIFDSNHLDRSVVVRALEAMRDFTVPVYLLPANHDPLNAASVYRSPEFAANRPVHVHVLETNEPVLVADGTVEVVGAPWESKQPLDDLAAHAVAALAPRPPGVQARVLVAHGAVDVLAPDKDDPSLIRLAAAETALASGQIDYIALGDRHSTAQVGATGRVWFAGTPLVTDFRDTGANHALVVELGPAGAAPTVTPHLVGAWSFVSRHFHVDGTATVDAVGEWLDSLPDKHITVVKLSFEGTLSLIEKSQLDDALGHHASLFAALDTWERHTDLRVRRDAADLDELGLTGFAATTLEELQALAEAGGPSGQVAEDALNLLFRLAH